MTSGLDHYWHEKGLARIGHRLVFCSLLIHVFLCMVDTLQEVLTCPPRENFEIVGILWPFWGQDGWNAPGVPLPHPESVLVSTINIIIVVFDL